MPESMPSSTPPAPPLTPLDFIDRRPLWHPELPFVVFWSHKAACTAIAHWFFALLGSPQKTDPEFAEHGFRSVRIHAYESQFKGRTDYLTGCVAALAAGRPALKFVRDPAARAYSAYLGSCAPASLRRPSFWGAKVRAKVVCHMAGTEQATPYSFVDFVEWMASVDLATINTHVRAQAQPWEARLVPEILPIEGLQQRLIGLERRFGLPAVATDAAQLTSSHHREKSLDLAGADLERILATAMPPRGAGRPLLPHVDSPRLAGTALGARLHAVLALDYAAYPIYRVPASPAVAAPPTLHMPG